MNDQVFPMKASVLWRYAWSGGVCGVLTIACIYWFQTGLFSFRAPIVLALLCAGIAAFVYFFLPTRANAERLYIADGAGDRRQVPWGNIASIEYKCYWGLAPGWALTDQNGKSYWLPREIENLRGRHALALEHGGPDHPLTKALERPLYEFD